MSYPNAITELAAGQTLSLRCRPGLFLQVTQGRLWVTQPHDGQDHFVCAGTTFRLAGGHVVLQADCGVARYRLGTQAPVLSTQPEKTHPTGWNLRQYAGKAVSCP